MGTDNSKDKQASSKRNLSLMEENGNEAKKLREVLVFEANADGLHNEIRSRMIELGTHQA